MSVENITEVSTDNFVEDNLLSYGKMTLENRVLADFRDGLKPVHRRIIWAAHLLHLERNFVKSARLVGETLGKFHPHGDQAVYDSMVTMVNMPVPLFEGQGNWGNIIDGDNAAQSRYTELRLSKYSISALLGSEYLECVPMHSNYDGMFQQPLYLPSLLPTIFLTGNMGIAVGLSVKYPIFTIKSLAKVISSCLKKRSLLNAKYLAKNLEFETLPYGGVITNDVKTLPELFTTSKPRLFYTVDWKPEPVNKEIHIYSSCPDLNIGNAMDKISALADVYSVENRTTDSVHWVIKFKPAVTQKLVEERGREIVNKYLSRTVTYSISATERQIDNPETDETHSSVFQSSVLNILNLWLDWRTDLERRMLVNRLSKLRVELRKKLVVKRAMLKLVALAKLVSDRSTKNIDQAVATLLSVSVEEARYVLSLSIRTLARLEASKLKKEIVRLKSLISDTRSKLMNPANAAAQFTLSVIKEL